MFSAVKFDDLELSELHLDALAEISNIGMGHAATALSQMVGRTIHLTVPEVSLVLLSEVPDLMGGADQVVAAIYLKIWGDLQGSILMIFPREAVKALCSLLTGAAPEEVQLSEMQASALREIGNILASSYLAALERLLGKTLIPSVPGVAFDMMAAVLDSVLGELGEEMDRTLVIKAAFTSGDSGLHGHFYLLPDPRSLRLILQAAKVMAEDSQ